MNKNPDRQVKATLKAGKKPETTDILLNVETHFPGHAGFSFDREGSPSTGQDRYGYNAKYNNFLGLDDTLLAGYMLGDDFDGKYIYHKLPLNNWGTSLTYGYNYSRSSPKKEFEVYAINSRAKNYSVMVNQDLFNKDKYLGDINLGIESKDKITRTRDGLFNKDRLRVIILNGNLSYQTFGGITYFTPEFSQGINGLGADRKNEFSSRGAKNTFSKFQLGLQHRRKLPAGLSLNLKINGQIASTRLTPQETFALGGINSVRGYASGDYLADNAAQTNVEILAPAFFIPAKLKFPFEKTPLKDKITLLSFFDYGHGFRRVDKTIDNQTHSMKSLGAGVRIKITEKTLLRLEWGFPLTNNGINESSKSRFHFSLDSEY
jgi:hemolysin activation/secretion protein